MLTRTYGILTSVDHIPTTKGTRVVSYKKHFSANIRVWGSSRDLSMLEVRAKLGFVAGNIAWEGDHIRLVLTPKDSKGLTKELVS